MTYSQQFNFGAGTLIGVRTDVSNPTPSRFGTLQEVTVDISFANKELYGQYEFPVAVARAAAKVTGKATFANINAKLYNDLFFDDSISSSAGIMLVALNEPHTVPTSSAYTVTATNSATFTTDLGVLYASTGQPLTVVSTSPAAGQYAVSASGVYTFAAADAGVAMLFTYDYSATSGGSVITLSNQLMGRSPTFKIVLAESYQGNIANLILNACISTKLSLPFKNQDFTMQNFEFSAFADGAGNWGSLTTTD